MLTRIIATFAALAVIGLAAVVAALPATAQSGGGPSGSSATATPTATPTATATPAPAPTSFAIRPHVGTLKPRALTRLGNKWYVSGFGSHGSDGRIHVFSNDGTFEKIINNLNATFRGLTNDGTNLIAVTGFTPRVHTWNPSTDSLVSSKTTSLGNKYRANGIAHDGTNTWIAVFQPQSGTADLLKLHGKESTLHRVSAKVDSLTHVPSPISGKKGFLYATQQGADNPDLLRINIDDLSPHTPASILTDVKPPMNTWETVKRNAGLTRGLVFRNGIAYGFNADQDEVRQARQSPEQLFPILPHVGTLKPRALTRLGNKWYVSGFGSHGSDGRIHVFSNDGTFEKIINNLNATFRGLTNDGTNLIAVTGFTPRVHTWNPSTDSLVSSKTTSLGNKYRANGIAHDGTNTWIAVFQPQSGTADLLKLHGKESTLHRVSAKVDSLTHVPSPISGKKGFLYATQQGADNPDLLRINIDDLSPHTPASILTDVKPPMNTWETVKRNAGLTRGLVFRNGIAYGFNADQDEVRAERDAPTTPPASPTATPAPTASPSSGASDPSG